MPSNSTSCTTTPTSLTLGKFSGTIVYIVMMMPLLNVVLEWRSGNFVVLHLLSKFQRFGLGGNLLNVFQTVI